MSNDPSVQDDVKTTQKGNHRTETSSSGISTCHRTGTIKWVPVSHRIVVAIWYWLFATLANAASSRVIWLSWET